MIQSSPHSHAAEALSGGTGQARATGKAKRNGLASLFSSLLAEARSTAETVASARSLKGSGRSAARNAVGSSPGGMAAERKSADGRSAASRLLASPARPLADGAAKEAFSAGAAKAAEQATGKAQSAKTALSLREAAEKTEKEGIEGDEKARLSRRRLLPRDASLGSEGVDGAAQLAASAAVSPRSSVLGRRPQESVDARENKVEAADAKKKDKRKERLEIELYDHRTVGAASSTENAAPKAEGTALNDRKGATNEADLVVNLRAGNAERGAEDASRPSSAPQTSFSDALARELRENAASDIVKHASLVLKDGGEGLLRLSLKPDTLGAVKIRLEMADNRIAGRILVESDEALKAFEKELASLEQAFRDGGFDGASLELAVSSDGARGGSGERSGGQGPTPFFSERLASTYDAAVVRAEGPVAASESLVNVLV